MVCKLKIQKIRSMESNEAVDWLISHYPIEQREYGDAISLIATRTWKKPDQLRLASYYLKRVPFSSVKIYQVFLSVMSIPNFIQALIPHLPDNQEEKNLLLYHLLPVLKKSIKNDKDEKVVDEFKKVLIK